MRKEVFVIIIVRCRFPRNLVEAKFHNGEVDTLPVRLTFIRYTLLRHCLLTAAMGSTGVVRPLCCVAARRTVRWVPSMLLRIAERCRQSSGVLASLTQPR